MVIRRACLADLDKLVENRLEFVSSICDISKKAEFKSRTREYLQRHLEGDTLLAFITENNGKIIASCILCIYDTLPTPSCLNGKSGLLLNVYTLKEYRRQGLAYRLLTQLIEEARRLEVKKIQLDYTDEGYPLYKKLGFEKLEREMVLKL